VLCPAGAVSSLTLLGFRPCDEDVHDAGTSNMLSVALSGGGGDDSLRGGVRALRLSSSCAPGRVAGCDDRRDHVPIVTQVCLSAGETVTQVFASPWTQTFLHDTKYKSVENQSPGFLAFYQGPLVFGCVCHADLLF
jgi:hypothetical protein